jgi:predicted lysophospholipase L1 biosynthesis ABC-type transport system permease subunit
MNKTKYTGVGIALGAGLGTVAGVLAGHIALWLSIGIAIGVAIGALFRRKESECSKCAAAHTTHEVKS